MNETIELTLEQEFDLRRFADQVQGMSHEQAQEFLVVQHRFMMVRETMYKQLLKHEWQLDLDLTSHQTEKES